VGTVVDVLDSDPNFKKFRIRNYSTLFFITMMILMILKRGSYNKQKLRNYFFFMSNVMVDLLSPHLGTTRPRLVVVKVNAIYMHCFKNRVFFWITFPSIKFKTNLKSVPVSGMK
jgi:hypothetical protein